MDQVTQMASDARCNFESRSTEAIIPRMVKSSYVFAFASAPCCSNISTAGTCDDQTKTHTDQLIFQLHFGTGSNRNILMLRAKMNK